MKDQVFVITILLSVIVFMMIMDAKEIKKEAEYIKVIQEKPLSRWEQRLKDKR